MAEAAKKPNNNIAIKLGSWIVYQPFRWFMLFFLALLISFAYLSYQVSSYSSSQEALRVIKHSYLIADLSGELPDVLTDSQYDFAKNKLLGATFDVAKSIQDQVYLLSKNDKDMLLYTTIFTYSLVLTVLRFYCVIYAFIGGMIIGLCLLVEARYRFWRLQHFTQVAQASAGTFAFAWGSRASIPLLSVLFMAWPHPDYLTFMLVLVLLMSVMAFAIGRSFIDRL